MSIEEIRALLRLAEQSGVQSLEFGSADAGWRAVWATDGAAVPPAAAPVNTAAPARIAASMPGRFSLAHPMVKGGTTGGISAGETLGFVRVGACLTRIVAPIGGRYRPLVGEGVLVGYGDEVFEVA